MCKPTRRFEHSRLKVERAHRHIDEVKRAFNAFLQTDFCRVRIEADDQTGHEVLKVDAVSRLPAEIPLALGDAVHNLRSSLDYVSTHFVGKDNDRVTFPFAKNRDDVRKLHSFRYIASSFPDLAAYILENIQPYRKGAFLGWEVAQLDNFDKHKLLIPLVGITGLTDITAQDGNGNTLIVARLDLGVGGSINLLGTGNPPIKVMGHGKPSADIFFPQGHLFEKQAVIPTCTRLADLTLQAIQSLETFCFGSASDPSSMVS